MIASRIRWNALIAALVAVMWLSSCKTQCLIWCHDGTEVQVDYVNARDDCQRQAEAKVSLYTVGGATTSGKDRNSMLLALFAKCMHSKDWGVTAPKKEGGGKPGQQQAGNTQQPPRPGTPWDPSPYAADRQPQAQQSQQQRQMPPPQYTSSGGANTPAYQQQQSPQYYTSQPQAAQPMQQQSPAIAPPPAASYPAPQYPQYQAAPNYPAPQAYPAPVTPVAPVQPQPYYYAPTLPQPPSPTTPQAGQAGQAMQPTYPPQALPPQPYPYYYAPTYPQGTPRTGAVTPPANGTGAAAGYPYNQANPGYSGAVTPPQPGQGTVNPGNAASAPTQGGNKAFPPSAVSPTPYVTQPKPTIYNGQETQKDIPIYQEKSPQDRSRAGVGAGVGF